MWQRYRPISSFTQGPTLEPGCDENTHIDSNNRIKQNEGGYSMEEEFKKLMLSHDTIVLKSYWEEISYFSFSKSITTLSTKLWELQREEKDLNNEWKSLLCNEFLPRTHKDLDRSGWNKFYSIWVQTNYPKVIAWLPSTRGTHFYCEWEKVMFFSKIT